MEKSTNQQPHLSSLKFSCIRPTTNHCFDTKQTCAIIQCQVERKRQVRRIYTQTNLHSRIFQKISHNEILIRIDKIVSLQINSIPQKRRMAMVRFRSVQQNSSYQVNSFVKPNNLRGKDTDREHGYDMTWTRVPHWRHSCYSHLIHHSYHTI